MQKLWIVQYTLCYDAVTLFVLHNPQMKPTALVYAELQLAYDTFNQHLFDNSLADCVLTLQRKDRTMGYFSPGRWGNKAKDQLHEIAINPAFFAVVPLVETMATIVHEMVHLWQQQHGTPPRGRYHDKEWGDKMESIGLMPSSTGQPGGRKTGDKVADYPIEGGRFLAVCSMLITQEFKLSWYDRFTEYVPSTTGAAAPGITLNLPAQAMDVAAVSGLAMVAPAAASGVAAAAVNKSNRSKYTCSCAIAVWGKPGLNVVCGECDERFAEA
jgi:predicted SprT family Zn-dependent metalloprotease